MRIAEIESVNNIEPSKTSDFYTQDELEPLLYKMRTAKQKQLLSSHFLDLKKTYMVEGKTAFNKKFNSINCLGRSTIILLLSSFKEGYFIIFSPNGLSFCKPNILVLTLKLIECL